MIGNYYIKSGILSYFTIDESKNISELYMGSHTYKENCTKWGYSYSIFEGKTGKYMTVQAYTLIIAQAGELCGLKCVTMRIVLRESQ